MSGTFSSSLILKLCPLGQKESLMSHLTPTHHGRDTEETEQLPPPRHLLKYASGGVCLRKLLPTLIASVTLPDAISIYIWTLVMKMNPQQ